MSSRNFIVIFSGLFLLFSFSIFTFGSDTVLHALWNTPTMHPIFADIRTITGVNETISLGLDPLVSNPGDPWNRSMNYPRIWQYIAEAFHFNQEATIYFGIINISLYALGFMMFVSRIKLSNISAIFLLLGFYSPASLLAIERGNIDMVMFFLVSLAIFFITRPIIFSGIILLATVLKIFPVFSLAGLLRESKNLFFRLILSLIAIFIGYVFLTIDDIVLINSATPQSGSLSYGLNVIPIMLEHRGLSNLKTLIQMGSYIYVVTLIVTILYYIRKIEFVRIINTLNIEYIDAFRVGSAIYLMTFLISTNWDYRLIFLIFTMPQLILWSKSKVVIVKNSALLAIASILIAMWYLDIRLLHGPVIYVIEEISNWVLFSSFLFLFIITMPTWIFESLKLKTKIK